MSNIYCLTFGCANYGDNKCFYNDPFSRSNTSYYSCTPNPDGNCRGLYPVYLCPSNLCWYDICNPDLNANTYYSAMCIYWYYPSYTGTYVLQRFEQIPGTYNCHLSILPIPLYAVEPTVFEAKTDGTTWWLESNGVRDFIPLGDVGYFDGASHNAVNCICEYLIDQGRVTRGCPFYTSTACYVCSNILSYALNFSCYTSCIDYKANDCPTIVPTYMTVCSSGQPEEKPTVSLSYKDKQVWSYGYSDASCTTKCYCNFPMDTSPVCFGGTPVDTLRYNNTNNILHKGTISSGTRLDVSGACCCAKWDGEVTFAANTYCITNPACGTSYTRCIASVWIPQNSYRCDCCFCKTCITEYNLKVCGVELVPQIQTYAPDYYYAIPENDSELAIPINSAYSSKCQAFYSNYGFEACIDIDKADGFLDNLIDQFVASVPSHFNQSSYSYDKLYSLSIGLPFAYACRCPINCCLPLSYQCQQRLVFPVTPDRELIKTMGCFCCWYDCGTYYTFLHCNGNPLANMCERSYIFNCCVSCAECCIRAAIDDFRSSHSCACATEMLDVIFHCLKRFNLQIFRGYPTCIDIYSFANPICYMGVCANPIYCCGISCSCLFTDTNVNLLGNNLCGNCGCVCDMIIRDTPGPAGTPYASKCCWTVGFDLYGYSGTCCLTPIGTVDFSCPYNKLTCMDKGGGLAAFKQPVDESTYCCMVLPLFCNYNYMYQFNTCSMAVVPSEERTLAGHIFMKSTYNGYYPYGYDALMAYFQSCFDNLNNTSASPHTTAICNAYNCCCSFLCYTPKICYHGLLPVPQFSIGLYKGCY